MPSYYKGRFLRWYGRGGRRSFKSRAFGQRSFYRKRSWKRIGGFKRSKAVTQRRYAGRIERALKVEYKVGDVLYAATAWSSDAGGQIYPLINDMAISTGTAGRDRAAGNQFTLKGLYLGITFESGSTATAATPITIALVRSQNRLIASNIDPTENDVFDMGNISTVDPSLMVRRDRTTAGLSTATNTAGVGPFGSHKIIWLKRIVVPLTGQISGTSPKSMLLKKVFKMNTRVIGRSADAATWAACTPEYTLMGWSDIPAAGTTQRPNVVVYARIVFTDM